MFYVSYLVGGSSNFTAKSCVTKYADRNDPKLLQEVAEIRNMGYLAMAAKVGIGGFCSFNEFETKEKRADYYSQVSNTYNA